MAFRSPWLSSARCGAGMFASVVVLVLLGVSGPAQAKRNGFLNESPQACGNCHYETRGPQIQVKFSKDNPDMGEQITVDVLLKAVDSKAHRTGVWLSSEGSGKFSLMDMQATRLHTATDALHAEPKALSSGEAKFQFRWTAPSSPGVTNFQVYSVTSVEGAEASKYNNSSSKAAIAYGCDPVTYYDDADEDGFGDEGNPILSCEVLDGKITKGGDCKDDDPEIHPDAEEICDSKDNNCDGELDEGLEPGLYYPDKDGDGFAPKTGGGAKFACNNESGFSMKRTDCNDRDADVSPDATEICGNDVDDDCDGDVDEDDCEDAKGGGSGGSGSGSGGNGGGDSSSEDEPAGGCSMGGSRTSSFPLGLALVMLGAILGRVVRRRR